jgi:hypothetical protein
MALPAFEWIREQVESGRYFWSHHADQERQADELTIAQVEQAVLQGRVIENYPDTGRGESCLIAGFCDDGTPIHVVCGVRSGQPVIVTTYVPTPPKFKNPFQRG